MTNEEREALLEYLKSTLKPISSSYYCRVHELAVKRMVILLEEQTKKETDDEQS